MNDLDAAREYAKKECIPVAVADWVSDTIVHTEVGVRLIHTIRTYIVICLIIIILSPAQAKLNMLQKQHTLLEMDVADLNAQLSRLNHARLVSQMQ